MTRESEPRLTLIFVSEYADFDVRGDKLSSWDDNQSHHRQSHQRGSQFKSQFKSSERVLDEGLAFHEG